MKKMQAVIYHRYGPPEVLRLKKVPIPSIKKNQVLIRVKATTVTAGDWRMRKAEPFIIRFINGPFAPWIWRTLGMELSGVIEKAGSEVTLFKEGDEIFGFSGFGAYAEFKSLNPIKSIYHKPSNLTFEQAAAIPVGANTALYYLRDKGGIQKDQNLLIYGASGSVGTYAIQLAKFFGAKVSAVCSTKNLELVRSLGADQAIDYTQGDFTALNSKYDIIFDAVGKTSKSVCKEMLKQDSKYLTVNKGYARGKAENLKFLSELIERELLSPVIDRQYPLEEIVEAHRYVQQGHKKGNVVIKV